MIERVIDKFPKISLLELQKVSLLRRFDTKYFFHFSRLEDVLNDSMEPISFKNASYGYFTNRNKFIFY